MVRVFSLLTVCAFVSTAFVVASIHYVSPTGSATWANSTALSAPCSTGVAFANANAGDTVYFRGGTYNVPAKNFSDSYHGYYEPTNSGTANAPIVFMAYPGEAPVFNGTSGGTGDIDGQGQYTFATIFGTNDKSYIIFDGFTFQANKGTMKARIKIQGAEIFHRILFLQTVQAISINRAILRLLQTPLANMLAATA